MTDFSIQPAGHGPLNPVRNVPALSPSTFSGYASFGRLEHLGGSTRGSDRVELSDDARLLAQINALPDVRHDRIERVRAAIADGGYDNDQRIDSALERLIAEEDLLA